MAKDVNLIEHMRFGRIGGNQTSLLFGAADVRSRNFTFDIYQSLRSITPGDSLRKVVNLLPEDEILRLACLYKYSGVCKYNGALPTNKKVTNVNLIKQHCSNAEQILNTLIVRVQGEDYSLATPLLDLQVDLDLESETEG